MAPKAYLNSKYFLVIPRLERGIQGIAVIMLLKALGDNSRFYGSLPACRQAGWIL